MPALIETTVFSLIQAHRNASNISRRAKALQRLMHLAFNASEGEGTAARRYLSEQVNVLITD